VCWSHLYKKKTEDRTKGKEDKENTKTFGSASAAWGVTSKILKEGVSSIADVLAGRDLICLNLRQKLKQKYWNKYHGPAQLLYCHQERHSFHTDACQLVSESPSTEEEKEKGEAGNKNIWWFNEAKREIAPLSQES